MGLKNGLTLPGGIELTDSYIKINKITIYQNRIYVELCAYKDKETRTNEPSNILSINLSQTIHFDNADIASKFTDVINNIKTKLYEHAKATEFSSFTDA